MRSLALVLGLVLLFAISSPAQITSGSLSGSVTDPSGQVIVGATVTITSEVNAEKRSAKTNETGDFSFTGLVSGGYTIHVEAKGFRSLDSKNNIVGAAGRTAVGRLQLEVGSVSESVTVTSQGQEVATTTTSQQSVLDSKQVAQISLRGRDPMTLLRILPGVQQGVDQDTFGGAFSSAIPQIQDRTTGNTVYIDGVNGGDGGGGGNFAAATNVDAIAEVNVQLGSYTAEYGLKGGAQVNMVSKRGGDQFHGSAYWYIRNEALNANNFFSNRNNQARPLYRYSTQGGTLGGPIPVKIPVINPKGHQLFFFLSLDDTKIKEPSLIRQWTMPTALERVGDFSQSKDLKGNLIVVKDPLNNTAFPNNFVPSNRANQYGVALMNITPLPNFKGACVGGASGCNFLNQAPSPSHPRRQWLYRFDLRPTDKDTFSIKHSTWYTKVHGIEPATTAPGSNWGLYSQEYDFTADTGGFGYTRIISPSMVNEFSGAIMYDTELGTPTTPDDLKRIQRQFNGLSGLGQFAPQLNPLNLIPWVATGSLPNNSFFPNTSCGSCPLIQFDGRTPNTGADTAMSFSDNLTYLKAAHSFKFGVMREFERFGQARSGTFAGQFDVSTDANDPGNLGYAYANLYAGHTRQYSEQLGRPPNNRIQATWAWFAQDTWKVRKNVTLDLGLRMYKWAPPLNAGGEASQFSFERYDPTWGGHPPVLYSPVSTSNGRRATNPLTGEILPATFIGMMVPGTGYSCNHVITAGDNKNPCLFNGIVTQDDPTYLGGDRGVVKMRPVLFDPRFGMAWDVFGDSKMAIRASFGVMHNATSGALAEGGPAWRFDKLVFFTDMSSFLTGGSAVTPINVSGTWKDGWKQQVNYNYTLGVQRELGWHTVLDVAYVGILTHHNPQSWNFNLLPAGVRFLPSSQDPTAPGKPLPDAFLRPILGWGDMNIQGPATKSRYDSLQSQVTRRFTSGLELTGVFTYAGGTNDGFKQNNPLPSSAARARNLAIQQLVFNFSYVYDLPHGSKLLKFAGAKWVLDNWQLSGITTFANGQLSDVSMSTTDGFDFTGGGDACDTGIVQTGDAKLPHGSRTFSQWFNTSVFQRPSGRGDLGNNCNNAKFRLPGFNNHDMSLFKNFPIREAKVLQLRWEMYNALNHTQFNAVNTTANFNAAGQQTAATFGQVTSAKTERRMQASLRFTF
jgi:hypothetical protein